MAILDDYWLAAFVHDLDTDSFEIKYVRQLKGPEAERFSKAFLNIVDFARTQALFYITERNCEELEAKLDEYSRFDPSKAGLGALERFITEISRLLINYLSTFIMFVNHLDMSMNAYSKDSTQYGAYEKDRSAAGYDKEFAYRFLYRLRNFITHSGIPVDIWEARCTPNRKATPYAFMLKKRELLLSGRKKYWGNIIAEVEALPDYIPIQEYCSALPGCLDRIRVVYLNHKGDIFSDATVLNDLMLEVSPKPLMPYVPILIEPSQPTSPLILHFPIEDIELIVKYRMDLVGGLK